MSMEGFTDSIPISKQLNISADWENHRICIETLSEDGHKTTVLLDREAIQWFQDRISWLLSRMENP